METVSSKPPGLVIVFTKPEEPGKVKTRLRPMLGDAGCLALHVAMLRDTLATCLNGAANVVLYVAGAAKFSFPIPVPLAFQAEGDLGYRMSQAFRENLETYDKVVIVGTDAPGLTPELVGEALQSLDENELVIGPTLDGGYYLIGLRKLIPEIFQDVEWSTGHVLSKTLERTKSRKVHLLPQLYDIDHPEDLTRLEHNFAAGDFPHARHTRACIRNLI